MLMIIMDMQPFSLVEDKGFNVLIKSAYPDFIMPSRHSITESIELEYLSAKKELEIELAKAEFVSSTSDGWTDKFTQRLFATVSAHYYSPNDPITIKSVVLETYDFGVESHTGANIASQLKSCFESWHITSNRIVLRNCIESFYRTFFIRQGLWTCSRQRR